MKLWHSFKKELLLSAKSFYFYIELAMAVILLLLVLFVIPADFGLKKSEYIYLNLPEPAQSLFLEEIIEGDSDGEAEVIEMKIDDEVFEVLLYENEEDKENFYLVDDEETVIKIAEEEKEFGAAIELDDEGQMAFRYYIQGYESQKYKNLLQIFHVKDMEVLEENFNKQELRPLSADRQVLSEQENALPPLLVFNGSLMGLFLIAAYIFLDKKEGIIKAYAVTASPVWVYLMSKVGVIMAVTLVSTLILVVPIMGLGINYPLLLLFLFSTGFFASSLGLLLASYYKDIIQAFAAIYIIIIALIIPNMAYFIPSWEPTWIKFLPSYPMLEGFKEIIKTNGDLNYVFITSGIFFLIGLVLFLYANKRYKKTLSL